jgi:hypothetical protein
MGKEPPAKDSDEEPLFDDTKFAVKLLRSAFRKLEGVGEAFNIEAHHDVYKDPSMKGLAFRIHGLAEKLDNLPVVKQAACRHSSSTTAAPTVTTATTAMTAATVVTTATTAAKAAMTAATAAMTAATAATTAGLRLIDRLLNQLMVV